MSECEKCYLLLVHDKSWGKGGLQIQWARLSFSPLNLDQGVNRDTSLTMTSYFPGPGPGTNNGASPASSPLSPPTQRSSALSNRLTSVLSASYADSDIRDALETLSIRGIHNTAETRRQLRLDVQKEVVDSNAEIVRDFGKVAEVSLFRAVLNHARETNIFSLL